MVVWSSQVNIERLKDENVSWTGLSCYVTCGIENMCYQNVSVIFSYIIMSFQYGCDLAA